MDVLYSSRRRHSSFDVSFGELGADILDSMAVTEDKWLFGGGMSWVPFHHCQGVIGWLHNFIDNQ
jgi:hypothetical protein